MPAVGFWACFLLATPTQATTPTTITTTATAKAIIPVVGLFFLCHVLLQVGMDSCRTELLIPPGKQSGLYPGMPCHEWWLRTIPEPLAVLPLHILHVTVQEQGIGTATVARMILIHVVGERATTTRQLANHARVAAR